MSTIRITTLGTGDAFASGGRGHSGILVRGRSTTLLIDPGPDVLTALKRLKVDVAIIDAILITHLHGDHTAGIPFLLLDYQFASRRKRPLIIAGPGPLATRLERLTTACYPELSRRNLRFEVRYQSLRAGQRCRLQTAGITALPMAHGRTPCLGYRVQLDNKLVAFTGDTAWCDSMVELAEGADFFLTECTHYRPMAAGGHLDYLTLIAKRTELHTKRIALVHVGDELLRNRRRIRLPIARDGQTFLV